MSVYQYVSKVGGEYEQTQNSSLCLASETITGAIKSPILRAGHIVRIEQNRILRKVLKLSFDSNRARGRTSCGVSRNSHGLSKLLSILPKLTKYSKNAHTMLHSYYTDFHQNQHRSVILRPLSNKFTIIQICSDSQATLKGLNGLKFSSSLTLE